MAVLDDMDAKLDQLLSLMGEEVNLHPDVLVPGGVPVFVSIPTSRMSIQMQVEFRVEDREGGRYLRMRLRDGAGWYAIDRAWKCVYRDPTNPGVVVDRATSL